ncbi:MAG: hypothetical protein JRN52_01040 [Nitrososphaerota archaeon]|nr:hypothetical protein [Nitrososphaerota archaeon]
MNPISKTKRTSSIAVLFLIAAMSLITLNNFIPVNASATSQTQGFNVINAIWGTSTSRISAAPGDSGDTLTLTLQYIYSATTESIQGYLYLPTGFSLYNGSSVAYASTSGTFPTGSTIQMSFVVNLASTLALGSYTMNLELSWTAAGYSYILNDTIPVTIQVEGKPQLYFDYPASALSPGQVNQVPFIISNNGSGAASNIFVTASSQVGGILNTIPEILNLSPGSVSTATVEIYVPASTAGSVLEVSLSASYKDPYGNSESANRTLDTYVAQQSPPGLQVSTNVDTLTPGQINSIPLTISNTGSETLSQISTSLTVQPTTATILGTFPYIQTLNANSSQNEELKVYVPTSLANSALMVTMTSTFVDSSGLTRSVSQTLGFYTLSTSASNITISVVPKNITVMAGQQSQVSFELENTGNQTIYNPTVTIGVTSPLVVVANSTYIYSQAINSKSSALFEATLIASPSSTLGTYSGTVTVTYVDQQGTQYAQTFNVGFILTGAINLIAESETASQNTRALSVSGSLLNEGLASAYYASVVSCVIQTNFTGSFPSGGSTTSGSATTAATTRSFTSFTRTFNGTRLGGGQGFGGGAFTGGATLTSCPSTSTSSYVGEIDPNSPVAFTASAAYTPSNTTSFAILVLVVTYQNSYGVHSSQSIDKPITITAISAQTGIQSPSTQSSDSHLYVDLSLYGVVIVVIASAVVGAVFVRRSRKSVSTDEDKVV